MNTNKIKILSVIVLLLFAGALAIPFVSMHENCDMADHNTSLNNCCDIDKAEENCCATMTECVVLPLHPIASAPLNKVLVEKNLTLDHHVSFSEIFDMSEKHALLEVVDKLCLSEAHPGFQIPLLV